LPFHINSDKGYYVTANNRQVPETARYSIGATHGSTMRSLRINELIEQGIKDGKKFTAQDMVDIQQDVVDVAARAMTPHILKIAETALNAEEYGFTQKDKQDAKYMMDFLKDFKGAMSQDSIPATVYSYWHYFFYSGFLHSYTSLGERGRAWRNADEPFWNLKTRLSLVDNYGFADFYANLVLHLGENLQSDKFDRLCANGFGEGKYKGARSCQYNVARAFIEAKKFIEENISKDSKTWQWKNVHVNEYSN